MVFNPMPLISILVRKTRLALVLLSVFDPKVRKEPCLEAVSQHESFCIDWEGGFASLIIVG